MYGVPQLVKAGSVRKASLRADPRARSLAALVESFAEEWTAWDLANVSCAELVLELGSPALMAKVMGPLCLGLPTHAPAALEDSSAASEHLRQALHMHANPMSVTVQVCS